MSGLGTMWSEKELQKRDTLRLRDSPEVKKKMTHFRVIWVKLLLKLLYYNSV